MTNPLKPLPLKTMVRRFAWCHAGQHSVPRAEIVSTNRVGNICATCLNAQVKTSPNDRMVPEGELVQR